MDELDFQADVIRVRLRQLNSSQNSIQTMSVYLSGHNSNIDKIAKLWSHEVRKNTKGSNDWVLAMFYLANDIIQNARKNKQTRTLNEFYGALKDAIQFVSKNKNKFQEKILLSIERVIKILGDRGIYKQNMIDDLSVILTGRQGSKNGKDDQDKLLKEYENNIDERMKIRAKVFDDSIALLKTLTNPPSADQRTRHLISEFPEAIANSKNITPKTLDEARLLFEKTTEAFQVVNDYAKKVKTEIQQSESLKTQLISLDSFLKIESQLGKDLLGKANECLSSLKKKQEMLEMQKTLLPDTPDHENVSDLPDSVDDVI